MSETPGREHEPGGYMRLPLPVLAIGLFVLLAVLLGAGLYANANLRTPGVIIPTSAPAAAVATAAPATPVPALATPRVATPTPVPAATATSPPQPTGAPTAVATAGLTPLVTSEAATPTPVSGAANETPTPLPTAEPTLAAEVGQAYENFWQVKSQALLELDSTHLSDVMDGQYLADTRDLIEQLRTEGRAIKTQVSLNYTVVEASEDAATVIDDFVDNSIYVGIGTEDPLSIPTADQLSVLYRMRKISDSWKVIESVRSP